jgi:hypothetical protein
VEKKKPIYKRWWFWALIILIIIAIGNMGNDEQTNNDQVANEQEKTDVAEKETQEEQKEEKKQEDKAELTPQQEMLNKIIALFDSKKAFDTGSYTHGDIPKGEYTFVRFKGSGSYYGEEDLSGNIIDNENFDSFGYVYVHDAGNIQTQGVLINVDSFPTLGVTSAREIYEKLNNVENYRGSGWYKVGVDIPAGQYTIESTGQGYVAIMSGPVGNNEIVNNEIFNGKYSVNVSNGQYLQVTRGNILQ